VSSLLPPNATLQEIALDEATARIGAVPVDIRKLWDPAACPIELLPWLAWAFSVDVWDDAWSDAVKRTVTAASYGAHKIKGTPQSIIDTLVAMGYNNVEVLEGDLYFFNGAQLYDGSITYGGDGFWPLFDVRLNIGFVSSQAQINAITARIDNYKNARSVLRNLLFMAIHYDGGIYHDGTFTYNGGRLNIGVVHNQAEVAIHYDGSIYHDGTFKYNGERLNSGVVPNQAQMTIHYDGSIYYDGTFTFNGGSL